MTGSNVAIQQSPSEEVKASTEKNVAQPRKVNYRVKNNKQYG